MNIEELIPTNVLTNLKHLKQETDKAYALSVDKSEEGEAQLKFEQDKLEDYKRRLSLVPLYKS